MRGAAYGDEFYFKMYKKNKYILARWEGFAGPDSPSLDLCYKYLQIMCLILF